jgi:hypothetical protein
MGYESITVFQKEGPIVTYEKPQNFSYSSSGGVLFYIQDKEGVYDYYMTHNVLKIRVKNLKNE